MALDAFVNPKEFFRKISVIYKTHNDIFCAGFVLVGSIRHRHSSSPWYCPDYVYNRNAYEDYPEGSAAIISYRAAKKLLDYGKCLPGIFCIDDAAITGMRMSKN